jgi:hypothetical protein
LQYHFMEFKQRGFCFSIGIAHFVFKKVSTALLYFPWRMTSILILIFLENL